MKKILITGYSGFVSEHFINHLIKNDIKAEILGLDILNPDFTINDNGKVKIVFKKADLFHLEQVENTIYNFQPDYLLHLASLSSVGYSWKNPAQSVRNNLNIFLNLMEVLRKECPYCRVLSVGSCEEYGDYPESELPLREEFPLKPLSPYAVARVAQEQLSKVYCDGYGMNIVMTRSFNHIGSGQKDIFVISSFIKQLVEIKYGLTKEHKLITGDTGIIRDFLDVRDVVDAYFNLFEKGESGEVYNICSGKGKSLKEIIDLICTLLNIKIDIEIDENRIRPNENRVIIGSNEKLVKSTGWMQKYSMEESLKSIIEYWEKSI